MDANLMTLVDVLVEAAAKSPVTEDGRRLPTERELQAALGVSRQTVREQIAGLEILGLVNRTQGRGTYLETSPASFMHVYAELALRIGFLDVEDLEEAREGLEFAAVISAVTRATAEDLARLRGLVEKMAAATAAGDDDGAADADLEFHRELYSISGQPLLDLFASGLSSALRDLLRSRRARVVTYERSHNHAETLRTDAVHAAIVEAIEGRDKQAALAAVTEHFSLWRTLSAEADSSPNSA